MCRSLRRWRVCCDESLAATAPSTNAPRKTHSQLNRCAVVWRDTFHSSQRVELLLNGLQLLKEVAQLVVREFQIDRLFGALCAARQRNHTVARRRLTSSRVKFSRTTPRVSCTLALSACDMRSAKRLSEARVWSVSKRWQPFARTKSCRSETAAQCCAAAHAPRRATPTRSSTQQTTRVASFATTLWPAEPQAHCQRKKKKRKKGWLR